MTFTNTTPYSMFSSTVIPFLYNCHASPTFNISTPTSGFFATLPVSNCSTIVIAYSIGIAKPIPSTSSSTNFNEFIPITSPFILHKGPPLLPGLIAASI